MAYIDAQLHDALKTAGVPEDQARKVAESRIDLDVLEEKIKGMGRGNVLFRWAIGLWMGVNTLVLARAYFLIIELALRLP